MHSDGPTTSVSLPLSYVVACQHNRTFLYLSTADEHEPNFAAREKENATDNIAKGHLQRAGPDLRLFTSTGSIQHRLWEGLPTGDFAA